MSTHESILVSVLRNPVRTLSLRPSELAQVIQQGRRANLLGELASRLDELGVTDNLPEAARDHFSSALLIARRQHDVVRREIDYLRSALARVKLPLILLKGAAYVAGAHLAGSGRVFSDIDLLVRKSDIANAEAALRLAGWQGTHLKSYDQRYYRKWMHEIPPMVHVRRETCIDVHHAILPIVARTSVDTEKLFERVQPIGRTDVLTLDPLDMIIHSATHLMHEGEPDNLLRDLYDIHLLVSQAFRGNCNLWSELPVRALELGLGRVLFYTLRLCEEVFQTEISSCCWILLNPVKPFILPRWILMVAYHRLLQPYQGRSSTLLEKLSAHFIFLRSHWLKMPLPLLVAHITYKYFFARDKVGELSRIA